MSKGTYIRTKEHNQNISKAQRALGELHWTRRPETRERMKLAMIGRKGYWLGKKRNDPNYLLKISLAHKGQNSSPATQFKRAENPAYALVGGMNAYRRLHVWIEKQLGKPSICSKCGIEATGRQIHWANVSGKYKGDISDWIRLCARCHYNFDAKRQIT